MLRAQDVFPLDGSPRWRVSFVQAASLSPFSAVEFFVRHRGESTVIGIERGHIGAPSPQRATRLATLDETSAFLEELESCLNQVPGAVLREAPPFDPPVHGERDFLLVSSVSSPVHVYDVERSDCGDVVRRFVMERVTLDAYRHPFWGDGEFGTLRLDADVPASVSVEGVRVDELTPIVGLRVQPGTHRVEWTQIETGVTQTAEVEVLAGQVTSIRVRFGEAP